MDLHATVARGKRAVPPSLFTGDANGIGAVAMTGSAAATTGVPVLRTANVVERGRDAGGLAHAPPTTAGFASEDRGLPGLAFAASGDVAGVAAVAAAPRHGVGDGHAGEQRSPTRISASSFGGPASHHHSRSGVGVGHTRVHLLQRLICCAGRLHRLLRAMGLLGDADDSAHLSQMLVCACATIAALLLLLLFVVAALIVTLVVVVPDAERQVRQTLGPLLDVNTGPKAGGGAGVGGAATAEKGPFDMRRLVQDSGLREFLREAQRAEELRRRMRRNATLLAQIQKVRAARAAQAGANGTEAANDVAAGTGVDLLKLAQTLPELERVAYLLHQVSAHINAIHAHDPVLGLVEVGNFLLNAKGRPEALKRAAERARTEGLAAGGRPAGAPLNLPSPPPPPSTPAAAGGGTQEPSSATVTAQAASTTPTPVAAAAAGPNQAVLLDAALKRSFVGRSEAARLRAQLRGFVGVAPTHPEALTEQPFDDLAVLQYRHAWMAWEVLPALKARAHQGTPTSTTAAPTAGTVNSTGVSGGPTAATAPLHVAAGDALAAGSGTLPPQHRAEVVATRLAMKADLYDASSIFNHRYYYPLRRYEALRPYSGDGVADTDAWYSPIAAVVQARFGAALTTNPAATTVAAQKAADAPLSLLTLPRLDAARAAEVAHLGTPEDTLLMPRGLDAAAPVNTRTIFVSLASYRDAECAPTLLNLFHVARNPHRVYVGLAQQNRAGDSPCLSPEMYAPYLCPGNTAVTASPGGADAAATTTAREARARARVLFGVDGAATRGFGERVCYLADQIRVRSIDSRQAKGPTYGRYMAMLLYRGEDMTLVLDSHNRFRPMWDTLGLSMQARFDDPKAVLSHYPEGYGGEGVDLMPYRTTTAYLCKAFFLKVQGYPRLNGIVIGSPRDYAKNNVHNDPYVRVKSREIAASNNFRLPQPWVAGGFLLAPGAVYRDVPFDPHLPYIFDGEEILYSVRLWTHGYNIYSPERGLCFHIYGRAAAPKIWAESAVWYSTQDRVRQRIQFFIQTHLKGRETVLVPANTTNPYVVIDSSRYGMGKERTVAQWYDYAGGDPVAHTFDGRWCGVDTSTS